MREPLRFSWRHWWNLVMVLILAAGATLWRLGLVDGRLAAAAVLAWILAGRLLAPSIMYEHLGFLDRHVFHDYGKARARYRRAEDTKKATPQGQCVLASLSFGEGDDIEAARLLEEAAIKRPDDPHLFALLSRVLSRLGRHDEAVAAALRCANMKGRQPLSDAALADALRAKGEMVGAASAYQRVAKARPHLAGPRIGLAGTYLWMGKFDAAEEEARAAVAMSPRDPDALYWAGKVAEAKGDAAAAGRYYKSALEVRPIGDRSPSVAYQDLVRAVSATAPKDGPSLGQDERQVRGIGTPDHK